jgi:hypothetical protein
MKTKNKQTVEEIIAANNVLFDKASAAQKRVLIARDVIARVKAKTYTPVTQSWVKIEEDNAEDSSLQKALIEKTVKCNCCALGGLMLSCVAFKDQMEIDEAESSLDFSVVWEEVSESQIGNYFSSKQLQLIEGAFERGEGFFRPKDSFNPEWDDEDGSFIGGETFKRAIAFGEKYKSEKDRLIAIMENIIENNGQFKV